MNERPRPGKEVHEGTGDAVVATNWPPRPGIVTFECRARGGDVAVESDGTEPLLVNTIAPYAGSRWINIATASTGTRTTRFVITAPGRWRLTVADPDAVAPSG